MEFEGDYYFRRVYCQIYGRADIFRRQPAALFDQLLARYAGIAGDKENRLVIDRENYHVLFVAPHPCQVVDGHAQLGATVNDERREPGFF